MLTRVGSEGFSVVKFVQIYFFVKENYWKSILKKAVDLCDKENSDKLRRGGPFPLQKSNPFLTIYRH